MVKSPPAKAGDTGSMPDPGGSPGGGHGNAPQCLYLGNPRHRGAWRAPGVTESDTSERLSIATTPAHALLPAQ